MKKYIFLFFLFSCAPQIKNETLYVEPEFQVYLDEFETLTKERYAGGVNFASSGSLDYYTKDAIGICINYNNGDKEIKIDRGYWLMANEEVKEQLLFHELGHCVFEREHKTTLMIVNFNEAQYAMPQSIMYPVSFGGLFYKMMRNYYISELIDEKNSLTEISL